MIVTRRFFLAALFAGCGVSGSATAGAAEQPQFIERGGVRFFIKEKRLEIDGKVTLVEGPIELLACARGGKEHESIISAPCKPSTVKFFATLMGLKEGTPDGRKAQRGSPVFIHVRWQDGEKTVTRRAEELIWNAIDKRPMRLTPWVFVGGRIVRSAEGKRKVFLPDAEGTIVATFRDLNGVFKLPLKLAVNDEAFVARKEMLPPQDTACTMIISRGTWPSARRNARGGRIIEINVSGGGRVLFDGVAYHDEMAAENTLVEKMKTHRADKANAKDTYVLTYDHGAPPAAGMVAFAAVEKAGLRLSEISTRRVSEDIEDRLRVVVTGDRVQFGEGLSAEQVRAAVSAAAKDKPFGILIRIRRGASYAAITKALEPLKEIENVAVRLVWGKTGD
jgi:hypothetical protein